MLTWKWHMKLQRRYCYRRELFEQGSCHRWCKLTVAVSLLLTIHFFKLSGQGGLVCLFQCAVTVAKRPWQWSKWMGQHWSHVQFPACCNKYHMAKQLVVCFQDSLLVGTFSYSWLIYVRKGLELLPGKWVMERLLSESDSFILKVLVCYLSTCIDS